MDTIKTCVEEELIYGRKFGMALTLKAFHPVQRNGGAIILVLSEGWYSSFDMIEQVKTLLIEPIIEAGYIGAVSSDIAAAAIFFPLVDFLNWGEVGKIMLGDHPAVPLFGAFDFDEIDPEKQRFERVENTDKHLSIAKSLSPLEWVSSKQAPTYLVVGDADPVVPPEQSYRLADKMKVNGVAHKLQIISDGGHDMNMIAQNLEGAINWFDTYLLL